MRGRFSHRDLARYMASELVKGRQRRGQLLRRAAAYLIDHKAVSEAGALANDVASVLAAQKQHLLVQVTTASKLSDELAQILTARLSADCGTDSIELDTTVDPRIIGGMVVRTPDQLHDGSIAHILKKLQSIT